MFKLWKKDSIVKCGYCKRVFKIVQNQLEEIEFPDEISSAPVYEVVTRSKNLVLPPLCSICLNPAEKYKKQVPYCNNCYNNLNKVFNKEAEGMVYSEKSEINNNFFVLKFRNPQHAKMFRELNKC